MAGLTLANAAAALKEFYLPGARNQINNDTPLLAQLEKNTEDIEGKRAVLSIHIGRNSGVGARAEGQVKPTAGSQSYLEERIPVKFNYGSGRLTGPTIKAMKTNRGSFVRAIDSETKGLVLDLKRDVNRQAWGNQDSKIATCGVTGASATVVLAATTTDVQLRQLEIGMVIDVGTVANPQLRGTGLTISAVDTVNKTITVDSAITTAGTDFIFRQGAAGTTAAASANEITGMSKIVGTGALHNITDARWESFIDSNGGVLRPVSENLLAKAMMNGQIRGGEWADIIIMSDGVYRAFANLLTALKRFDSMQKVKLKGGYSGVSYQCGGPEVNVVWDRDTPANSAFGLATDHIKEYQMSDWEFMDEDGAVLSRATDGTDAYEFSLFKYHEVGTDQRNTHWKVTDLQDAA